MRIIMLLVLAATLALCQTPSTNNFAAAGVSVNPGATPAIAGTGLWARLLNKDTTTYAFTVVDALPVSVKPFQVNTQVSAGIAQKLLSIRGVDILVPTAAGVSWSGNNVGWSWSSGGAAVVKVGQGRILPNVRFIKSSNSGGAGYQIICGILIGVGW